MLQRWSLGPGQPCGRREESGQVGELPSAHRVPQGQRLGEMRFSATEVMKGLTAYQSQGLGNLTPRSEPQQSRVPAFPARQPGLPFCRWAPASQPNTRVSPAPSRPQAEGRNEHARYTFAFLLLHPTLRVLDEELIAQDGDQG